MEVKVFFYLYKAQCCINNKKNTKNGSSYIAKNRGSNMKAKFLNFFGFKHINDNPPIIHNLVSNALLSLLLLMLLLG